MTQHTRKGTKETTLTREQCRLIVAELRLRAGRLDGQWETFGRASPEEIAVEKQKKETDELLMILEGARRVSVTRAK